ncbi:MAG TPA: long-chain fatty acid--CoA ligase [Gaiellaceae bacterium]|jgi:long-chain acyl-CoA synthetase|nr:long-chain fatty acid--CoA ligase [Gaiellaceae bacterium]
MAIEVERATGTKTIANLWRRAESRSGTAYLVETDGEWREISWEEARSGVDEIANGLLALGVAKGDAFGIVARTTLEWVLFDFALGSIGAIGVGIYPTLPAKDCAYILDHSDAVGVLLENNEQREKIESERTNLPKLQHVLTFADLDGLRSRGREYAAANPDALEQARNSIGEADLFTYIYTSGTTGPPKGCMITHRNYYEMVGAVDDVPEFIGADDLILLYLPLAHNFGRCLHLLSGYVGSTIAFCPDPLRIGEVAPVVKPTVLPSVPRVYEKVHTAVQASFDEATGLKRGLIDWALRVGKKVSELQQQKKPVPAGLAFQHRLADKLVYSKVKAKLGGRLKLPISGGAPLAKEIAEFFHTIDIAIMEGYGQTECTTASNVNMPTGFRFGTVGPAIPGIEVRIAGDGEILVRGPNVFAGYYKDEEATREVLDDEGWLHTGDIGSIDDGFLTITDRKKDIIVTAQGKNVAPQNIENELKGSKYVSQALVIGDRRPYLTALITLDEAETAKLGTDTRLLIEGVVDEYNRDKASFEQVKRFAILPRDFSAEEDEVTPTMKLRRKIVAEHFADEIEALYAR